MLYPRQLPIAYLKSVVICDSIWSFIDVAASENDEIFHKADLDALKSGNSKATLNDLKIFRC